MEVGQALERSMGVIPVLVGGAVMPDAEELPSRLTRLARRHAIELSDRRWPSDVNDLVLAIEKAKDRIAFRQNEILPIASRGSGPRCRGRYHYARND